MALWLPLMRGTFTKPAEQPISTPPGNDSLGTDWNPPSVIALAPFEGSEVDAALEQARTDRDWQVRQAAEDLLG